MPGLRGPAGEGGRGMRGAGVEVEVAEEAAAAPTIVLLHPSPYPGTSRKVGGWRAGRERRIPSLAWV